MNKNNILAALAFTTGNSICQIIYDPMQGLILWLIVFILTMIINVMSEKPAPHKWYQYFFIGLVFSTIKSFFHR